MDELEASLFPFPEGWYFVARRRSLARGTLIERPWLGRDIVAWCDEAGSVCVAEATCPHLGSSLGPAAGGRVRGGRLVCPFHGFAYDAAGRCVSTPFADPPPSARLKVFEIREIQGLVFAWWSPEARPPRWTLPEPPAAERAWSALEFRSLRFPGHPQETTENSVDLTHLQHVHGYSDVVCVGPTTADGAHFRTRFDFRRRRSVAGLFRTLYDVAANIHVHGLGYSFVDIEESTIGMRSRLWVLATPLDGTVIEFVLASQVERLRKPNRAIAGFRFLPTTWRTRILNKLMMAAEMSDVRQDVTIWRRKRYRPHPRLSRGDGAVGKYRRYCKQFYS